MSHSLCICDSSSTESSLAATILEKPLSFKKAAPYDEAVFICVLAWSNRPGKYSLISEATPKSWTKTASVPAS